MNRSILVTVALGAALNAASANAGTALQFNGTNQYVTMGTAPSLGASNLTIELWFRRTAAGATTSTGTGGVTAVPLVTKGRGEADGSNVDCNYFFGINGSGQLVADFEAAPAPGITAGQNYPVTGTNPAIQNNVWYHAAATYDVATHTWKLYLNGAQVGTSTTPPAGAAPRADSIQHFGIGTALTSNGTAAGFFAGVVDEVRIWNVARSQAEVAAGMNVELPSTPGLIGRFALNEGTGATTTNAVGVPVVGTLTPAANPPAWVAGQGFGPSVAITTPADGATVLAPATLSIEVAASIAGGTITQVELLRNGIVVGTDSSEPFSFFESRLPAGRYTYSARATDNLGASSTSAGITVKVAFDPLDHPANTALSFDGVDDYVTMGVAPALNAGGPESFGFTLECWFRKDGSGVLSSSGNGGVSGVPLFGKGRGEAENSNVDANYFFAINTGGQLVADFEAYPATGITAGQNYPVTGSHTPITNGSWHHAAVTYDGPTATWNLYLDGTLAGSASAAADALPRYDSIQHFAIGAALNSTGVPEGAFAGVIDEVRVWNYARSAGEIADSKDQEIGAAPGLVGRYGLNEAGGTAAANSVSASGAPLGALTNGPVWVDGAVFAVANTAPSLTLESPVDGASSVFPAPLTLSATASDSDGLARVELHVNGTKVFESAAAPFAFAWVPPAPGSYAVFARAIDTLGAVTTSATAAFTITPSSNQPPVVTPLSPAKGATSVGSPATLAVNIADPEGDAMTVAFYGRRTAPLTPGPDFTLIAVPDTQFYSENIGRNPSPGGTGAVASIFEAQTLWIVDNRLPRNIAFVSHMGDIVQNGENGGNPSEWIVADGAMKTIEDQLATLLAYGIPWGGAPGNHDMGTGGGSGTTNFYNQFFGADRWLGRTYYGGHFGSNNDNHYELWSASGLDFLSIHLSYDARAVSNYQAVLDWADALLKAYPNRRATVTSHWIVNTGDPATFSTQGRAIYDTLKVNPNLFLLLCGHVHGEGKRVDVYQGRSVYSILQDYQDGANGGNGFLRIYTFSPANNTIRIESYSPTLGRAVNASDAITAWTGPYQIPYDMQTAVSDFVLLGTVSVPAGGTQAAFSWGGLESGAAYEWFATASDGINSVASVARRFATAPASAPSVLLTAPLDGATIGGPTDISLTADASDADGTITRVEFYVGNTKLGTDTTAPYEFVWGGVAPGHYELNAVAVDDSGRSTLSNIVDISVVDANLRPVVAIVSPGNAATFDAPASIDIRVDASDGDGSVAKVEFFRGSTKLGEDTSAPFELTWAGVASGGYTLTAVATDDDGATTTSDPVSIVVTNFDNIAPAVAINSPADGASVNAGGTLALAASADDSDGAIAKVEFYAGAQKLGEDTTTPFAFNWMNVPAGDHSLTAVATDNDGGMATSQVVHVSAVIPPPGAMTYFQDFNSMGGTGTTPPAGWSIKTGNSGTSNSTWTTTITGNGANSVASMVNASGALTAAAPPSGTNNNGFNAAAPGSTTNRMLATSPTSISGGAIQLQLSNESGGAVDRLRIGYDIQRFTAVSTANELPGYWFFYSLDSGATWTNVAGLRPTLAGPGVSVPNTVGLTNVPPILITLSATWMPGTTILFRWVDDNAVATSPDQIVGLDNVSIQTPIGPMAALVSPVHGGTFTAPASIPLEAAASDSDGTIARVDFYAGATKLGEDASAPYTFDWTGVPAGAYTLTAVAVDNDGDTATSADVHVVVEPERFVLSITAAGEGRVRVSANDTTAICPDTCAPSFEVGTLVAVSAEPATGWRFTGWGGACAGDGECSVLMDEAKDVTALLTIILPPVFPNAPPNLAVNATSPAGAVVTFSSPVASDSLYGPITATCVPASGSTFATGTTSVTCTATNGANLSATTSFSVTVNGASEQLQNLLAMVDGVGPGSSLTAKLQAAQAALAAGDNALAAATLRALINEVQAQSGKKIPAAQANAIIAAAQQIRAVLGYQ